MELPTRKASAPRMFLQGCVLRLVWWIAARKVPREKRPPSPDIPLLRPSPTKRGKRDEHGQS